MDYARYVVQPGDTIYKIAKAYNFTMAEIIHLNHLKHPDRIYAGQVLLLPVLETHEPTPDQIPEPNYTYAMWLFEAYAGADSELTAITTYLYQAVLLDRPEFDALLRPIAYDEMQHLEKLALALRHLGVDPRYGSFKNGHWIDWRSRFIDYTSELCSLLDVNIEDEAKAHHEYLELAQKIPIPEIQCILTEIAADEERHYHLFCQAKQQYCSECSGPPLPPCSPPPIYTPIETPEIPPNLPGPHDGGRG
ncbi:LysM peptidoglycan-binding domain-containing protein [Desulfosporosinus sp. Sb-LF]|uniref:LysM peptidoglycan-binding domain-containing protein n=1 Tax=Desulfosporosinus sp. Sb-LF TaxID=2560027 RepID=UPI00107FA3B5|nr:LysM peptidoglycan-binding domain-containing protein [Desulfosporosinus sp. Sb-LF]TGE31945.1 LysM peptidoglycan-binding domain-containing protein [Desulfosporosinus sp. Sb-LF]